MTNTYNIYAENVTINDTNVNNEFDNFFWLEEFIRSEEELEQKDKVTTDEELIDFDKCKTTSKEVNESIDIYLNKEQEKILLIKKPSHIEWIKTFEHFFRDLQRVKKIREDFNSIEQLSIRLVLSNIEDECNKLSELYLK